MYMKKNKQGNDGKKFGVYLKEHQSTETSLYGNIYDFVVDYKANSGTSTIYDMHRYLMTKHNIKS